VNEIQIKRRSDAPRPIGEVTTRELLEELRLRGDLAMAAMPTTPRGADGAVLSAMAGSGNGQATGP
jgi:hypothetical protein